MPGGRGEHGRVGAGQHRQAEAARDDRRVRAGAAAHRHRPGEVPRVDEADQVGRVNVGTDQDERGLGRPRRGRVAGQPGVDRRGGLADVARPLREVRVGQCLEDRGLGFRRRGDRGGRGRQRVTPSITQNGFVLRLVAHAAGSAGRGERVERGHGKRRVGGQQSADLDDVRLVGPSRLAEPSGERAPFGGDPGEGRAYVAGGHGRLGPCPVRCSRPGASGRVGQVKLTGRHPLGDWRSAVRGGHGAPAPASRAAASRRAVRISTVEAAPGSSWPTLRGPR